MNSIAQIYTKTINQNFSYLFANWEPSNPIELGDYGYLKDNIFRYIGNIKDIGISFEIREDKGYDNRKFKSSGTNIKKFNIGVDATNIVNIKAKLEISFSKEDSVFFNSLKCTTDMIRNKDLVGKALIEKYNSGDWKLDYVLVTDVITSKATTIVISEDKNSSILFEAKGDVKEIDLADANIGLNVVEDNNIGYELTTKSGLTPLFGLYQIKKSFWSGKLSGEIQEPELISDKNLDILSSQDIELISAKDIKEEKETLSFVRLK